MSLTKMDPYYTCLPVFSIPVQQSWMVNMYINNPRSLYFCKVPYLALCLQPAAKPAMLAFIITPRANSSGLHSSDRVHQPTLASLETEHWQNRIFVAGCFFQPGLSEAKHEQCHAALSLSLSDLIWSDRLSYCNSGTKDYICDWRQDWSGFWVTEMQINFASALRQWTSPSSLNWALFQALRAHLRSCTRVLFFAFWST